jgi:hypothetical protein
MTTPLIDRTLRYGVAQRSQSISALRGRAMRQQSPKEIQARQALRELAHFIGLSQRACVLQCFKGEEQEWFFDKVIELHQRITTMPKTYEQEGKGDQAIVYLHYFAGGQANAYITERDAGGPKDAPEDKGKQFQAFGLADMFSDGGEVGYISIEEWINNDAELDFHFTPCTLAELRGKRNMGGYRPE